MVDAIKEVTGVDFLATEAAHENEPRPLCLVVTAIS